MSFLFYVFGCEALQYNESVRFLDEFKYGSTVIKWLKINFLIDM